MNRETPKSVQLVRQDLSTLSDVQALGNFANGYNSCFNFLLGPPGH